MEKRPDLTSTAMTTNAKIVSDADTPLTYEQEIHAILYAAAANTAPPPVNSCVVPHAEAVDGSPTEGALLSLHGSSSVETAGQSSTQAPSELAMNFGRWLMERIPRGEGDTFDAISIARELDARMNRPPEGKPPAGFPIDKTDDWEERQDRKRQAAPEGKDGNEMH